MDNWLYCMKIAIMWLPFLFLALAVANILGELLDHIFDGKEGEYRG